MSNPPPARSGGLSLYANLLDPSSTSANTSASISRGPVVFNRASDETIQNEEAAAKKQQIDAATLRFQPTKRPQLASQKPKAKSKFPKAGDVKSAPTNEAPKAAAPPAAARPVKSTLADWTVAEDDDVNGFYGGEKRQRGGRKRRKKNKEDYAVYQDWDDIYDPARPNNYEEYKNSEEKIREVREWKDRLYAHRIARKRSSDQESEDEEPRGRVNNQFAPPPNFFFAPPPTLRGATAEPSAPESASETPPPPPTEDQPSASPPPQTVPAGTISRAPVRYNLPAAPTEIPASEAELEKALEEENANVDGDEEASESTRSRLPGQKGFAERLMSKYGWSKGSGLGADGSGIINPLRVQVEKRKKKSDAEGGGFRDAGGRGKIVGGQRAKKDDEDMGGRFGPMSDVIVLRGMVDGMDLDEEVEGSGDGGLMQEIGDECAEKYGRVERVYIDRHGTTPKVFVKFTSQLSALRAVNALEGRIFNGNTITALFHDSEKFEQGIYE